MPKTLSRFQGNATEYVFALLPEVVQTEGRDKMLALHSSDDWQDQLENILLSYLMMDGLPSEWHGVVLNSVEWDEVSVELDQLTRE